MIKKTMNQETKTLKERSQEFYTRMVAVQNLNPELLTIEMSEDIVQQYIEKYGADVNSPNFVDDLIELYNKQYSFNLENLKDGAYNKAIVILVENTSDESIFNVPLFNPERLKEKDIQYSNFFYNNDSKFSVSKVSYDMLTREFLNFLSESDETIRKVRIQAKSKTSSVEKQVLIPIRIAYADMFSSSHSIPIDNQNPTLLDLRMLKNIMDYDIKVKPFRKGLNWNLEFNEILPQMELKIILLFSK